MTKIDQEADRIEPILSCRTQGGWLEISPPGTRLAIGVMAPTSDDAKKLFRFRYKKWEGFLSGQVLDVPYSG